MSDPERLLLSRRSCSSTAGSTAVAAGAACARAAAGRDARPAGPRPGRRQAAEPQARRHGRLDLPAARRPRSSRARSASPPTRTRYAPDGLTTYIFGFANASGLADDVQFNLKNKAQHSAPLFWAREDEDFRVQLTNVGLAQRPDLFDEHTVHWHGFKNVIPFFDGEPTGSVSIPQGQTFTYVYVSRDPGTYMFHCHVEDTEHVQMGMTGLVFVRPAQDGNTSLYPSGKYAYNDGDGSTGFDREYAMFLSEVWGDSHWADAHIQLPEWSDYRADFSLLNGRVYPDTLLPNGSVARQATTRSRRTGTSTCTRPGTPTGTWRTRRGARTWPPSRTRRSSPATRVSGSCSASRTSGSWRRR